MKILLVRLRQIGDVVFTTPTFAALREHFPQAQLSYLVEPAAAPVVRGNPKLAHVIEAPRVRGVRGVLADLSLGRSLAREQFDIAIDFHGGPRASLLTWLSGAPRRVGYDVAGRAWMYTQRIDRPRALRPRHSVENQWDLLAAIGVPPPSRDRHPVTMVVDVEAAQRVQTRLAAHHASSEVRLAVIHVSAGNPFRRWPIASFAEVAAGLAAADPSVRVIVTSGPSDEGAAAEVIAAARRQLDECRREHVLSCGEFSLSELRALVERAALYVGGDSGPMHIAACSPVPMVSLYGPTLPVRSEPWRSRSFPALAAESHGLPCRPCDQRVCEPGDFRCLTQVTPSDVLRAGVRLLARNG